MYTVGFNDNAICHAKNEVNKYSHSGDISCKRIKQSDSHREL